MPEMQIYQLGDFTTQAGATIPSAFIAYKSWGNPKNPLIVYPTWYSGAIEDNEWLISTSHKALNPEKYFIVIPAMFGNSQSSSPSNMTGDVAGIKFPHTSIYDNVRAQHQLITEHFKLDKIFCAVGWSMGAAQSFQWATSYPGMVERIVPFCGAARTAHHNKTFLRSLILALSLDSEFMQGKYNANQKQLAGKKAFASIYSSWGFSQAFYREELFRTFLGGYKTLEDFVAGFWDPLFAHKDANDLIHLLRTWIAADITHTPDRPFTANVADGRSSTESYKKALGSIKAAALVMPGLTDLYFPPEDSEFEVANMPNATLAVIPSIWGHFAGGGVGNPVDTAWIDKRITEFFVETASK